MPFFTIDCHTSLSTGGLTHSTPSHPVSLRSSVTVVLHTPTPSKWNPSHRFPQQNSVCISLLPIHVGSFSLSITSFLSKLLSKILSICYSLKMRDHISHSQNTRQNYNSVHFGLISFDSSARFLRINFGGFFVQTEIFQTQKSEL